MKATEQYFPLVLFTILSKVFLTFQSVDEILKCDHSNESYWVALFCGTVYYAIQGGSNQAMEQRPSIWLDQSGRAWLNMNAILKKTTQGCRNVHLTVLLERFYLLCDVNLFFEFNMMSISPVKPHLITSNTLTTFDCREFKSSVPSLVRRRDNKTNNQSWRSTLLTTMKSHNASKNKL